MAGVRAAVLTLALASLLGVTYGYSSYQMKIPNGDMVPHPCKANYLWRGVGHKNPLGGGDRNPFGLDFHNNGKTWTRALCQADSDGDGKTNGQELGDPECVWTEGDAPPRTLGLSHPGVCEPHDSVACRDRNSWVTCDTGEFKCPAIVDEGAINITLRFAHTKVPPTETNYYCQTFDMPVDRDYHIIATMPLLNNTQVMHHMLLFGCDKRMNVTGTANSCDMAQNQCFNIIGGWTVGSPGECLPLNIGRLVGKSRYQSVVLQFHWNNPEKSDDYYDSSGLVVYLSPSLRVQNASTLTLGQEYLEIPPGTTRHTEVATLPGACTTLIANQDFYIITGLNHMHYLGRSQRVELFRNGQKVTDITYDEVFSYDSPTSVVYNVPVLVKRGDEIKTTCVFSSVSRPATTYYGDGTSDEMCFAFLEYYPAEAMPFPFGTCWKSLDVCERYYQRFADNCNIAEVLTPNSTVLAAFIGNVLGKCNGWGACRQECRAAVRAVRQHPCFQGDVGDYVMNGLSQDKQYGLPFLGAMQTCPEEFRDPTRPGPSTIPPSPPGPLNAATVPLGGVLSTLLGLLMALLM